MKRLLCLISGMNMGGAETFLMKVYRALDKQKYQMDFCVNIQEEGAYDKEILSMGGKVYRIPSKSEDYKAFRKALTDLIKSENYERVLRITSNGLGFLDLKIAKKAGAKVCVARSSNSSDGGAFKSKVAHTLGRGLFQKYVDVKIAPSDLAAEYTFGKNALRNGEVELLSNGVDLNLYRFDSNARNVVRNEFGVLSDELLIGHVGRFAEQKNHSYLIDIFQEIQKRNQKTKLLLVGVGELQNVIKQKVQSLELTGSVIFAGQRSDVFRLFSAMDVFVFPSLYEGMPNTVIEAQATGLPCVISDTITRTADLTGLVKYLTIAKSPSVWSDIVLESKRNERLQTSGILREKGYDIQDVVKKFTALVFEKY